MIIGSVFDQILGTLCTGFFTVILVISVAGVLGGRFLKRNEEARKVAKRIATAAALKAARRWLK
jgi:uncharacterized membrane protein